MLRLGGHGPRHTLYQIVSIVSPALVLTGRPIASAIVRSIERRSTPAASTDFDPPTIPARCAVHRHVQCVHATSSFGTGAACCSLSRDVSPHFCGRRAWVTCNGIVPCRYAERGLNADHDRYHLWSFHRASHAKGPTTRDTRKKPLVSCVHR